MKSKRNKRDATLRARTEPKQKREPKVAEFFTCRRVSGFQLGGSFGRLSHHRVRVRQQKTVRGVVDHGILRPPPWIYTLRRRDVTAGSYTPPKLPPHTQTHGAVQQFMAILDLGKGVFFSCAAAFLGHILQSQEKQFELQV